MCSQTFGLYFLPLKPNLISVKSEIYSFLWEWCRFVCYYLGLFVFCHNCVVTKCVQVLKHCFFFGGFSVSLWRPNLSAGCQCECVCVLRSVRVRSSHTLGGNTDVSVSRLLRDSFQFRLMMQELHKFSARERQKENRERVCNEFLKESVSLSWGGNIQFKEHSIVTKFKAALCLKKFSYCARQGFQKADGGI